MPDPAICDQCGVTASRLDRTIALKEMIEYMKGHEGVWFATDIEIAEW